MRHGVGFVFQVSYRRKVETEKIRETPDIWFQAEGGKIVNRD